MLLFSHQLSIDHVLSLLIERKRAKSMHADAAAGVVSQTKNLTRSWYWCDYHAYITISLSFFFCIDHIYIHIAYMHCISKFFFANTHCIAISPRKFPYAASQADYMYIPSQPSDEASGCIWRTCLSRLHVASQLILSGSDLVAFKNLISFF
jgi:hypothetical protein